MSRLVHRKITIHQWAGEDPALFQDDSDTHFVASILDRWTEMGDWWLGEGERKILRVLTDLQFIYDLECVSGQWFIYRVWD